MATIPFDGSEGQGRPPLTEHPAFPAMVALWFATLLGLGSLALPAVLLERVADATGLASLVPAAAPPLGATARALVALAGALAGAGLGVWIGRRVAESAAPGSDGRLARLAAGLRAPLSIDELGEAGLAGGEGLPTGRRRVLTIEDEERTDDGALSNEREEAAVTPFEANVFDEPLELSTPAEDDGADAFPPGFGDEPVADEDYTMTDEPDFQPAPPEASEPLPFAAPSLACPVDEPHAERAAMPLEELGLVQLVQRLSSTIEQRREWLTETAAAMPPAPARPVPIPIEAAPADEAAQAMAAYFGGATAPETPEATADDEDEGEDAGAGYSSLLGIGQPSAPEDEGEPDRLFDAPREPADADAALRAALATLQRMSGAA